MHRITIFGKGGIGKSTLSANLAAVYARGGKKVLLVGCDPKHDTTVALTDGRPIPTVVERSVFMDSGSGDPEKILVRGRLGIDCIEAGGPEPGIGCAGRGISRMIELMEDAGILKEGRYDVAIFDVLGDVVCGGFAAPLRQGFADKVVIVASEELMALYAANNIARAIKNYSANGVALCGLFANLRDPGADRGAVERFTRLIGTRVLDFMGRDPAVREAEYRRVTVAEHAPGSGAAKIISALAETLLAFDRKTAAVPTPLSDENFHELSRSGFKSTGKAKTPVLTEPAPAPREEPVPAGGRREDVFIAVARRPDLLPELSRRASLWEGDPGLNSQVWGDAEQWRRFFCDFETRRHARTRLEVRAPTVHVWHQDLECSYATPDYFDATLPAFFKFPWPKVVEPDFPEERGLGDEGTFGDAMTNLRDADIIHGGGGKLDQALEGAVGRAAQGAEAVVVHSTCVPTVIGDDAEAVVARWRSRSEVPILYTNPAQTKQEVDVGLALFKRLREEPGFLKVRKRKGAVNLVGFPEGPGLKELEEILKAAGVAVNARVLPYLSLRQARGYLAAEVQVFYPNAAFEATYREVFEPLPLKTLRPDAPWGWEATAGWVKTVAAQFKRNAAAALDRVSRPLASEWERARAEAAEHGLAFVVDGPHIKRLTDPSQMWGVPLLGMLREAGYRVEVLCHGESPAARPGLSFFKTEAELGTLLREGRFGAVYSEYAFDTRLAGAGKAQFALDCFEPGLGGALRTVGRLNGLCRWPFYRRYAAHLGAR